MRRRIIVAETAGFCFGVDRAVKLTYSLVEQGQKVCTLGPIIHNPQVIADLQEKGVVIIDDPAEAPLDTTVVIRAHGVTKAVEEQLAKTGISVCDATCPFVAKIHKIVEKNTTPDVPVLIAGDRNHPEVIGIMGHSNGPCYPFSDETELKNILNEHKELCEKRIIVVSQTTFSEKVWELCKKNIKLYCTNAIVFDTICLATQKRQEEAKTLSEQVDAMVVIGGRASSNTAKLKAVCSENCETYLVERASELKNINFSHTTLIGVTAGASTPAAIIKEVLLEMSENVNANNVVEEVPSELSFEEMLNESLDNMSTDQHVKGMVMAINPSEIQVDIGRKHAGYVPADEYSADPTANPAKELKVGDMIDLIIMKTNDAEGTVMLSKKRYDAQKGWNDVVAAAESEAVLEGTVCEVIKGGVLVNTNGARVFVPASQATVRRTQPLEELMGQKVKFVVIDINTARKRAVGSIRKVREAARDEFLANIAVDQVYQGTVKTLTAFGAFVEIAPGVEGLVHISELSWKRIKNPAEVIEVGQEIEVFIKGYDAETKKISLGYKKEEDNPWKIIEKDYPVDTVIDATIVSLTTFGAFATVYGDVQGLIHISQIADHRIEKPADVLAVGDTVKAKITAIDFEKKHISLSIRALLEPVAAEDAEETPAEEVAVEEAPVEEAPAEDAE